MKIKTFLLLMMLTASGSLLFAQGLKVEPGSCISLESGSTLDISNGNLVVSSNASSDASIIGSGTLSLSGGGQAEIQRYLSNGEWHLISSPVSGATAAMFTDDYLQYYSETEYLYHEIESTGTVLNPMQGYGFWSVAGSPTTEVFQGTPNSGSQSMGFTQTDFVDDAQEGYNLLGNPYPSAIDWDAVTIPAELSGAFWVFDPSIGADGDYLYYINGGGGANTTTQYIASGQGFFVRATSGDGTLQFTDAIRVHNTQNFYKETQSQEMIVINAHANNISSKTAVRFNPEATAQTDRLFDVNKLSSGSADVPVVYTECENEKMAINTLPSIAEHQVIPVYFKCGTPGNYSFQIDGVNSINAATPVFLEDVASGQYIDLRKSDSYSFAYSEGIKEFNLYFKDVTGIEELQEQNIMAWFNHDILNIQLDENTMKSGNYQISVYNLAGQEIINKTISDSQIEIPFTANSGAYFLRIENNGQVYSQKLIKQ